MKINFNVDNKIEFIKYVLFKILSVDVDGDEYYCIAETANNFLHEMEVEKLTNQEIISVLVNHETDQYFAAGFEEFFKNKKLDLSVYEWLPDTCDEKELLRAVEKYLAAETEDEFYEEPNFENAKEIKMLNFQDLFNDVFKKS